MAYRAAQHLYRLASSTAVACRQRHRWQHLVIHSRQFVSMPPALAIPFLCGRAKDKLRRPPEMTIVLVHNYASLPLAEKSLRYVGIRDYVVLRPKSEEPWRHTMKIAALLDYLESGACSTEYVFYVDSNDVFWRDDPAKAIGYLRELECELLFSTERGAFTYECMPEVKAWTDQKARERAAPDVYLNAGVFVGRAAFLREVLAAAMRYVTPNELSQEEFLRGLEDGSLCSRLPEFPKGVGTDQAILRYLHPRFHPRMQCDYAGRLAFRY